MRFARLALAAIAPLTVVGLGSFVGCSDPVPPTPQGAWSVSFQAQDSSPINCHVMGHNAQVGAVTDHTKDNVIPDGPSEAGPGAEVTCSVVSAGTNKFNVEAKMTQLDKGLAINIQGLTSAATEMAPALGTATFGDSQTGVPYGANMPCTFYFSNQSEGVSPGRVWISFKCPSIYDAGGMSTCQIKQGYAIFENCTQTAAASN